ncbi:hypothetical protein CSW98_14100 [Vibrio sp. HA2012]|uniref:hypothetical protein n=1 Tax=Vibrio sp. HA2012 TaxID=1971595 RepID=UPI000C2B695F|nr:hypothetical protein [Vibrio sp. HA2012]PJC85705.1 hypothetical protein CSW98_14100 [Vibrio sp. HA2012]
MSFSQIMQPHSVAQFTAQGTFLYVEEAPGTVRLRSDAGQYELVKGAQILNGNLTGLITVENTGEAGQVSLKVGNGEYRPPQRETLAISAQPPMQIAPDQGVSIDSLPPVDIAFGQSVAISSQPPVQIAPEQSVTVDSLPSLVLSAGQKIGLDAPVQIAAGQQIAISNLERVSSAFQSAQVALPHTFASNAARKKLILKAPATNVNPVLIGAYELGAGEHITLETTAEVTVTGSDAVQYIEV